MEYNDLYYHELDESQYDLFDDEEEYLDEYELMQRDHWRYHHPHHHPHHHRRRRRRRHRHHRRHPHHHHHRHHWHHYSLLNPDYDLC